MFVGAGQTAGELVPPGETQGWRKGGHVQKDKSGLGHLRYLGIITALQQWVISEAAQLIDL